MIDSKIPINALDLEGKKGDRKQNFNNNEFKREEVFFINLKDFFIFFKSALMKMLETSFMNMPEASVKFQENYFLIEVRIISRQRLAKKPTTLRVSSRNVGT